MKLIRFQLNQAPDDIAIKQWIEELESAGLAVIPWIKRALVIGLQEMKKTGEIPKNFKSETIKSRQVKPKKTQSTGKIVQPEPLPTKPEPRPAQTDESEPNPAGESDDDDRMITPEAAKMLAEIRKRNRDRNLAMSFGGFDSSATKP